MAFDDVHWIDPSLRSRIVGLRLRVGRNNVSLSRDLSALMEGRAYRVGWRKQDGTLVVIVQPVDGKGFVAHVNRAGAYLGTKNSGHAVA